MAPNGANQPQTHYRKHGLESQIKIYLTWEEGKVIHDLGLSSNRGTVLAWRCPGPHVVLCLGKWRWKRIWCVLSRSDPGHSSRSLEPIHRRGLANWLFSLYFWLFSTTGKMWCRCEIFRGIKCIENEKPLLPLVLATSKEVWLVLIFFNKC